MLEMIGITYSFKKEKHFMQYLSKSDYTMLYNSRNKTLLYYLKDRKSVWFLKEDLLWQANT